MANALKDIDKAIEVVLSQLPQPVTESETEYHKTLLNFLSGLRGQIKAFCFTWTGDQTFDPRPPKP